MAKKSDTAYELVLTAKAIRRAEKLERTLTKLAGRHDASSPIEVFLKNVQKGLEQLRTEEVSVDGKGEGRKKKDKNTAQLEVSPIEGAPSSKPSRKAKKSLNVVEATEAGHGVPVAQDMVAPPSNPGKMKKR